MTSGPFWTSQPREFVRATGADAVSYLQSQVSQDLAPLQVGESAWSLVLQPTGKVAALVRVTRTGETEIVLDTDAGYGEELRSQLDRFRIRVKAELELAPWRCIAVRGTAADGGTAAGPGSWAVPAWWGPGFAAVDLIGPEPSAPDDVEAGDAERLEAARIESGWPAMGREITEQTIPAELGPVVDVAVSFTKGCYPGQELVERMHSRGAAAPRQLRRLQAQARAATLVTGATVMVGGRDVGLVTSAVGGIGLALVGRAIEPGVEAEVGGVVAAVLALR